MTIWVERPLYIMSLRLKPNNSLRKDWKASIMQLWHHCNIFFRILIDYDLINLDKKRALKVRREFVGWKTYQECALEFELPRHLKRMLSSFCTNLSSSFTFVGFDLAILRTRASYNHQEFGSQGKVRWRNQSPRWLSNESLSRLHCFWFVHKKGYVNH